MPRACRSRSLDRVAAGATSINSLHLVGLTFVMVADISPGGETAFQEYQALVLPLFARHGGRPERRLRTDDALNEVHIVSFESRDGYESYIADGERQSHRELLDGLDIVRRVL